MYDLPAIRADHDLLWNLIMQELASCGHAAPHRLSHDADEMNPDNCQEFFLTQTCRTPYRKHLHHQVQLLGTPDYGLPRCRPGHYRSAIVARANDSTCRMRDTVDRKLAVNSYDSWSGWECFRHHAGRNGIEPGEIVLTGSHLESARQVLIGGADLAFIDQVTVMLSLRHDPSSPFRKLRTIGWTDESPGLPYVIGRHVHLRTAWSAVNRAIRALPSHCRSRLGLRGLTRIPRWQYMQSK